MYDDVRNGLQKVQTAVPKLRAFKRAAMMGIVLPVGDSLNTFLPTYLYIAVVSLLHDALQVFVKANYPGCDPEKMNLRTCIDFLSAKGRKKLKEACE
jgi:hypothetical protein